MSGPTFATRPMALDVPGMMGYGRWNNGSEALKMTRPLE